jgi:hypothetical protein
MTDIKTALFAMLVMIIFAAAPVYGGGGAADNGLQYGTGTQDPRDDTRTGEGTEDTLNDNGDDSWAPPEHDVGRGRQNDADDTRNEVYRGPRRSPQPQDGIGEENGTDDNDLDDDLDDDSDLEEDDRVR